MIYASGLHAIKNSNKMKMKHVIGKNSISVFIATHKKKSKRKKRNN